MGLVVSTREGQDGVEGLSDHSTPPVHTHVQTHTHVYVYLHTVPRRAGSGVWFPTAPDRLSINTDDSFPVSRHE